MVRLGVACLVPLLVAWGPFDVDTRRDLVRACEWESSNVADWKAIPWVLLRRHRMQRRGWTFSEQIRLYSRLDRGPRTPRQRRIWERPNPRAVALVDLWARGEVPDPCPLAVHWAGPGVFSPLPVVDCGDTSNVYRAAPR